MGVQIHRRNAWFISAFLTTLITATSVLASLSSPVLAGQTIPYTINFQGRLTDNNGNILPDGSYNIKFRIFDASSAGTNKWEGDRVYGASDRRVAISNGLFNIQFGDTGQGDPALSPTLFSGTYPLYLEVELPTPATATCNTNGCASFTEGAMTPRQALASTPYAFNSDTLDGLDSSGFIQNTTTQQPSSNFNISGSGTAAISLLTPLLSTVSGDINIDPTGNTIIKGSTADNTAAALKVTDSGGSNSLLYVRNDGSVGIGTGGPSRQLHVYGLGQTTANLTDAGNTGATLYLQDSQGNVNNGGAILFGASQGSFAAIKSLIQNGSGNTTGDLVLSTRNLTTDTALTERLRVTAAGNVGIGTSGTPSQLLSVGGTNGNFTVTSGGDVTTAGGVNSVGNLYTAGGIGSNGLSGLQSQSNNLNVLANSSFEVKANFAGNNPDGWFLSSNQGNGTATTTRASDAQFDGTYSIKSVTTGTTSFSQIQASSYVPVKPSTSYYNAVDVRHDTTANNCSVGLIVRTNWYTSGFAPAGSPSYNDVYSYGSTTTSWVTYGGAATSPSNAAYALVEYYNFFNTGNCTRWFDNAVFRQVGSNGDLSFGGNVQGGTLTSIGAITGATTTNTINGAVINSGALSSITGITLSSGNITTPGNISTTGTGTITSAGAITAPTATNTINNLVINNGSLSNVGNITGAGAVTLSSTTNALTLTSGSGTISLGSSIMQRAASGLTLDVFNAGASTLTVTNSDVTNVASLAVEGGVSIGSGQTYKINNTQISSAALSNDTNLAKLDGTGPQTFTGNNKFTGTFLAQNASNSTSAFQILNQSGQTLINVDTASNNSNNLVTNPSIESAIAGNWALKGSATVTQDSTDKYYGSNSLKIQTTAAAGDGAKQTVTLSSATSYTMTLYARSSAGNMNTFEIGRSENGSTDTACLTAQMVLKGGWTRYTCTFLTGTVSGSPYIYVKQTDAVARNSINIDAIILQTEANYSPAYREGQITLQGTITSPLVLQNSSNSTSAFQVLTSKGASIFAVDSVDANILAGNAGFEVTPNGWTYNGTPGSVARDSSQAYTDSYSLRVVTTANSNNGAKFTMANGSPAAPNLSISTQYTLSWYAKLDAASAAFTDMTAGYSPDGGAETACVPSLQTVVSSGWTRYSCSFTTPATTPTAAAYIIIKQSGTTAHTFYLDSVQLELGANATAYGAGNISFNAAITSPAVFRTVSDSTTAFQIQGSSGSLNLFTVDNLNDRIGLNTATPQTTMHVVQSTPYGTYTDISGTTSTLGSAYFDQTLTDSSFTNPYRGVTNKTVASFASDPGAKSILAAYNEVGIPSGNSTAMASLILRAQNNAVTHAGTNTLGTGAGLVTVVRNNSSGTITDALALQGQIQNNSTGIITNAYGLNISNITNGGTIANTYGAYIGDVTTGTQTNTAFSFYASDTSAYNYFAGATGINSTVPGAQLDVKGTTADNTASALKIQNSSATILLSARNDGIVNIGSATTDTTQVNLQLDSFSTFADSGTCNTTTNQGALYYNTNSNAVRSCVNGAWEDLVTTGGLGLITYGVVPDSGSGAGDIGASSGATSGPCRVSWLTTTTVKIVNGCMAYSGGRKVIIPDNTTPTGSLTFTAGNFIHVCLNGTNNQPAFSASGAETANMPTWSSNNPVVCLADIKTSGTAITNIYDTRTFTTSTKTFVTAPAAVGLGWIVVHHGSNINAVTTSTTALSDTGTTNLTVRGVIVAYSGSVSTTTPNAIMVSAGAQYVKATGTSSINGYVGPSTTAGYSGTYAAASPFASSNFGAVLGISSRTIDTACNATTNCQYSQFVNPISVR